MRKSQLQELAARNIQLWTNLLWVVGKIINFRKIKTYTSLIKWTFTSDGNLFLLPQTDFQTEISEPPDYITIKVHTISPPQQNH